ncbi:SDR family oxidoreductase [Paraglaciecola aquimarina]|uniref:SDR family oxidoreductase n=1 Tax=Paraglaciecola algarum TaxID=3050085 RepID=A0ABS9D6P3_9ALTE|nr:SDR family oxidoreductase [Paraglaciecola sp. G1-23]MCF2947708.1 SDR family oxidoreductase [Paraglaciecola sp. G1-23]
MTKTALITGGASGLGKALAHYYAKQGFEICVADINIEQGIQVCQDIQKAGGKALFITCDITLESSIETLKSELLTHWHKLDVLINNAGVATAGAIEYEDIEQWQWVMNINVFGMVRMCRAFVPLLAQKNTSQIINIASQAGITPISLMASYNASKAAVVSFSETMHIELAPKGIHVCVACPSFFATNLGESLRSTQPGIRELVAKLLSRSDIDATNIAKQIFQASENNQFMIVTHKKGRQAYRLKRWLPTQSYLTMMKKKLKHFRPKSNE